VGGQRGEWGEAFFAVGRLCPHAGRGGDSGEEGWSSRQTAHTRACISIASEASCGSKPTVSTVGTPPSTPRPPNRIPTHLQLLVSGEGGEAVLDGCGGALQAQPGEAAALALLGQGQAAGGHMGGRGHTEGSRPQQVVYIHTCYEAASLALLGQGQAAGGAWARQREQARTSGP